MRQSELEKRPGIADEVCNLLAAGTAVVRACQKVGITDRTFYNWKRRGMDEAARLAAQADPDRAVLGKREQAQRAREAPYLQFFQAVTRAEAQASIHATTVLRQGMLPSQEVQETTETVTETRLTKDGKPYEYKKAVTRRTVITRPGDWRAALEYLKRRDTDDWTEHTVVRSETKTPEGERCPTPVAITIVPPPPLPECVTDNGDSG